jgi:hypothetical protein
LLQARPTPLAFYVSLEDGCDDPGTLTLSRHKGSKNLLIPDPFYFVAQGYAAHVQRVAAGGPFGARRDQAVWRGATTGRLLSKANLFETPRVALAAYCAAAPELFDVKLNAVVQVHEAERADIEAMLTGSLKNLRLAAACCGSRACMSNGSSRACRPGRISCRWHGIFPTLQTF